MKKFLSLLAFLTFCASAFAQSYSPGDRPHMGQEALTNKANTFTPTQTFKGNVVASGLKSSGTPANAVCTDSSGNVFNSSGANCYSAAGSVINGYIYGFTLSNDGGTPNSVLDVAAGYAADSTNASMITGTAFTKSTAGSWVAGTGNNGMGVGLTIANNTWYHVYAIIKGGSYDVYFDTSASAANAPASTTYFRYIGSFRTDGSHNILTFTQYGQTFYWASPRTDLNAGTATTETAITVSTPLGFVAFPIFGGNSHYHSGTVGNSAALYAATSANIYMNITDIVALQDPYFSTPFGIYTNTSSQISYNVTGGVDTLQLINLGYVNQYVAPNR